MCALIYPLVKTKNQPQLPMAGETVHATGQRANLAGGKDDGKASLEVKGQKRSTTGEQTS